MREFNIKNFTFGDIRIVAQTFTELGIEKEQLKGILDTLTGSGAPTEDLSSKTKIENYLTANFSDEEAVKIKEVQKTPVKIKAYLMSHSATKGGASENIMGLLLAGVDVVGTGFEAIVNFIDHFVTDITRDEIYELDGEDSAELIKAVFTNEGIKDFFSRMFN